MNTKKSKRTYKVKKITKGLLALRKQPPISAS